ncbi:MAG: hypothetical protein HZB30_10280 [Nitrospirae bacterium]|nr:hypothetical protein [Nitrospirota bacterium]
MKSEKFINSILSLLIVLFASSQSVYSLEVGTHEAINENVAKGSLNGISFDNYLKNNIGIAGGINEYFNDKKVFDWIKIGGRYEDKPPLVIPYVRSVNHFHNPLTEEGFSGYFYGLLLSGDSSVVWAQKTIGTQSPISDYSLGGNYSWHDTRDYFYRALTSISTTQRETYFAKTFRGIGQVMHLVEDASVPAHTRDDAHVIGYHYELAVDKFRKNDDPVFTNAIANPRPFDPSILTLAPNPLAPVPIAKIFDTDVYDGLNASAGINQGLAEYTNANFFSEDTIFDDAYSYPKESSTDIQNRYSELYKSKQAA